MDGLLNDDYEGGETEYLYYKKRIQPERGKLLIWPAGMTHCHRGGLVLKGISMLQQDGSIWEE